MNSIEVVTVQRTSPGKNHTRGIPVLDGAEAAQKIYAEPETIVFEDIAIVSITNDLVYTEGSDCSEEAILNAI